MKKVNCSLLALSLMFVGNAMATPDYTGNTTADFTWDSTVESVVPDINDGKFGYYLWSNDTRTDWSLRWIGDADEAFDWYGSIVFRGINSEDTTEVSFEGVDDTITGTSSGTDYIDFVGYTGPYWDGVDFTLSGVSGELEFYLGYDENDFTAGQDAVDGVNIFIGSGFESTMVDVYGYGTEGGITQNFEIKAPVPEPTTMLLFGTGLIGLAGIARRKKK